jgi:3-hydroxyisobutyrate dehydrogenase-like beta-hydroxyacid dehydrogenase
VSTRVDPRPRGALEPPALLGFVGLGHLGTALVSNLLQAGYRVEGFDLAQERYTTFDHPNFSGLASLGELSDSARVIFTCVVTSEQLESILSGIGPAGAGLRDKTVVDLSTLSATGSARVARLAERLGASFLRATVSGNSITAKTRDLSFVCSGPLENYEECGPLFEAMGKRRRHIGHGEEARVAKLATNLVVGGLMVLLAEAVAYGERAGLPASTLMTILSDSAIGSPFVQSKASALADRDYTSIADIALILKDLGLADEHAQELMMKLPVLGTVIDQYARCAACGWSADDFAAVLRLYEPDAECEDKLPSVDGS